MSCADGQYVPRSARGSRSSSSSSSSPSSPSSESLLPPHTHRLVEWKKASPCTRPTVLACSDQVSVSTVLDGLLRAIYCTSGMAASRCLCGVPLQRRGSLPISLPRVQSVPGNSFPRVASEDGAHDRLKGMAPSCVYDDGLAKLRIHKHLIYSRPSNGNPMPSKLPLLEDGLFVDTESYVLPSEPKTTEPGSAIKLDQGSTSAG